MGVGWSVKRLLGVDAQEPLLREIRRGGAGVRRLVFTRNRRVMVSLGEAGEALRLHECFREAPAEVLRAIGVLVSHAPEARRSAARAVVRDYVRGQAPAAAAPAPRRRRRPAPADRAHLARLQAEFDAVNRDHFGDRLPRVPLHLSGRMRRRNGHFSSQPVEIVLSRTLCDGAAEGEAEKTLRHEMIHLWQYHVGRKPGHGEDFRRWAERLGVHPRATRTVDWK
ncbi:MAG TPA: SprT-like domain-containing protein [Longimicrobiaceae bacterium]|nr:SprT-like domain-containing protein [Longimicrobiaceae bacterium]